MCSSFFRAWCVNLRWLEDACNCVLGFMRWCQDLACLCIVHLGESQWEHCDYGIHTGWGCSKVWKLALNSQAPEFGGWEGSATHEVTADDSGKIMISIPKWCCLVYRLDRSDTPECAGA